VTSERASIKPGGTSDQRSGSGREDHYRVSASNNSTVLKIDSHTPTLKDKPNNLSCSQQEDHNEFKLKPIHER